jgi:DNA gyrase subunit A
LIRGAADVDTARAGLMAAPFEFTEVQATYILDMQLRRLTQLEGQKLRDELAELRERIKELESILKSKAKLNGVIKGELTELRDKYSDKRKTRLMADVGEIDVLDLIEDEEVIVVLTKKGYIKTAARAGVGGA